MKILWNLLCQYKNIYNSSYKYLKEEKNTNQWPKKKKEKKEHHSYCANWTNQRITICALTLFIYRNGNFIYCNQNKYGSISYRDSILPFGIQVLRNLGAHKYEILIFSLFLWILCEFSYSFKNILLRFINTISTVFFINILTEHVLPYCLLSAQTWNFRQFDWVQCMLWNLSVDNWKWSSSSRTVGNIVVGKFSMCKCIFPLLWLILTNTTN